MGRRVGEGRWERVVSMLKREVGFVHVKAGGGLRGVGESWVGVVIVGLLVC